MLTGFKQLARSWMPQSVADLDQWMEGSLSGAMPTYSGYTVSETSAMQLPAVWASVDLLGKAASVLPGHVFRKIADGGIRDREKVAGHYLYPFVHDSVNPWMSAMEWRRQAVIHYSLWGNHYSWIEWASNSRPKAFWPIAPDTVRTERKTLNGPIKYFIRDGAGQWVEFQDWEILHFRGLSIDGHTGLSPIGQCREAVGLVGAAQQSAAALHKNGFTSRLVLEYPQALDAKQMETIKDSFNKAYAGLQNAHKALILQNGMTAKPFSMNPHDAEFLAQMKYSDAKIYQMFGVPAHMVGDTERATSWGTGIEQQTIGFVTYTLLPIMNLLETTLERKLLPDGGQWFIEYEMKGLLRGDTAARSQWHRTMIESGVSSPNDVRRYENEDPIEGGDVYRRPMNMQFVNSKGEVVLKTEPAEPKDMPADKQEDDNAESNQS